jgi:hypothetical protein
VTQFSDHGSLTFTVSPLIGFFLAAQWRHSCRRCRRRPSNAPAS